ncbi:1155_t:CDS:1, partial [Entrophospora sp. SA101]
TELGIAEDTTENTNKRNLIQEVQRITKIYAQKDDKKIKVCFATEQAPPEQLKDKPGATEIKEDEYNIYLQLERKDKQGNFCPNLVF